MTLVDRYLRAVRDHLPRGQQDDIIDELSDSIQSQIEDQEAALGRPLGEDEQVALLRGFGHPMAVAARYRGDERSLNFGRQLIGPELFPTYLKILALNFAVTIIFLATVYLASGPIWTGLGGLVAPFAIQFVAVTAIFILVDRHWIRDPNGWDPRTLNAMGPDVDVSSLDGISAQLIGKPQTQSVSITSCVLEIGLLGLALALWLAIGLPQQVGYLAPGPGWADLFVPVALLTVVALLIPVVNLVRPRWTRFRVAGHALVDVASIGILAVSLALGNWVVLADPATAPADAADLVGVINGIIRVSIALTIVLMAISAALEVRRFVRIGRPETGA